MYRCVKSRNHLSTFHSSSVLEHRIRHWVVPERVVAPNLAMFIWKMMIRPASTSGFLVYPSVEESHPVS